METDSDVTPVGSSHFTSEEAEHIFALAEKLTGTCQTGKFRRSILLQNIHRRMAALRAPSLGHYLSFAQRDSKEKAQLISALTIHTTSWFREAPHFSRLEKFLRENPKVAKSRKPVQLFCGACSTGQEAYSFGLLLEHLRREKIVTDYRVYGGDIDPVSIKNAAGGIYPKPQAKEIPKDYFPYLLGGKGRAKDYFTLHQDITRRCAFRVGSLENVNRPTPDLFDFIVVRNVLIYFDTPKVTSIVRGLLNHLSPEGRLILGHSEAIDHNRLRLNSHGNCIYSKPEPAPTKSEEIVQKDESPKSKVSTPKPKRVLVVDDSKLIRKVLASLFQNGGYEVALAESAEDATEVLHRTSVDIITLDLNMPGTDGMTWLAQQRAAGNRTPVVIVSDTSVSEAGAVLGALEAGAQDYIEKTLLRTNKQEVLGKISALVRSEEGTSSQGTALPCKEFMEQKALKRPDLILVGASTGGTETLKQMLKGLPRDTPPLLVVQHISASFLAAFGERLAEASGLHLGDMRMGEPLEAGTLYIARDDYHIGVRRTGERLTLKVDDGAAVNRHRPSVDYLFDSVAKLKDLNVFSALMTGMGADGASGLLALKSTGAQTFTQSKESCVVYGMPREADALGASMYTGNPKDIRACLDKALRSKP